ncbi:hypothetical protein HWI79_2352 [Cryptosporidium felis]|nr:hypothetical protein HWI79_2352 [Cryptosporidium felis]
MQKTTPRNENNSAMPSDPPPPALSNSPGQPINHSHTLAPALAPNRGHDPNMNEERVGRNYTKNKISRKEKKSRKLDELRVTNGESRSLLVPLIIGTTAPQNLECACKQGSSL